MLFRMPSEPYCSAHMPCRTPTTWMVINHALQDADYMDVALTVIDHALQDADYMDVALTVIDLDIVFKRHMLSHNSPDKKVHSILLASSERFCAYLLWCAECAGCLSLLYHTICHLMVPSGSFITSGCGPPSQKEVRNPLGRKTYSPAGATSGA